MYKEPPATSLCDVIAPTALSCQMRELHIVAPFIAQISAWAMRCPQCNKSYVNVVISGIRIQIFIGNRCIGSQDGLLIN